VADNTGANFWFNNYPGGVGQPNAPAYGGGGTDVLSARDPLDAKRVAAGFAPGASYPDGYLGTITTRQEDKTMAVLQGRLTSTSYQRGVHAGSLQPHQAYFWTEDVNPTAGLQRQAQAVLTPSEGALVWSTPKFSPSGDPVEMLANDGKMAGKPAREIEAELLRRGGDPAKNPVTQLNPSRAAQMSRMLPPWSGVRRG
jgi:hypothetical protein